MQNESRAVERTCITCRMKGDAKQLIRYVAGPGRKIVIDYRHRLPGRGAYTCMTRQCLVDAVQKKSFNRALRLGDGEIDQAELLESLSRAVSQRIVGLIGIARKAGSTVTGTSMLQTVIARGEICFLIVAEDAAEGSVGKMTRLADQYGVVWARFSTQDLLGQIAGRESRNCVGIKDKQFAEILALEINRLQQIAGEN